jgi:hypothetical protein
MPSLNKHKLLSVRTAFLHFSSLFPDPAPVATARGAKRGGAMILLVIALWSSRHSTKPSIEYLQIHAESCEVLSYNSPSLQLSFVSGF